MAVGPGGWSGSRGCIDRPRPRPVGSLMSPQPIADVSDEAVEAANRLEPTERLKCPHVDTDRQVQYRLTATHSRGSTGSLSIANTANTHS